MVITEQIAAFAAAQAGGLTVEDLCIGVGYTGVKLSNGACGVSYTPRNDLGNRCGVMEKAGELDGISAKDAIKMSMSLNLAEAAVGISAINAVLNAGYSEGKNAMDEMIVTPDDTIGMIGYFAPVVNRFGNVAKQLYIFERKITDESQLPDWAENIYLPQCDVVVITGVTFINKTIDHVLSLCKNAKEIVLMGASVCMAPDILKDYGVTVLAGSKVSDPDRILKIIAQGGGGPEVLSTTQKLCIRLSDRRD